VTVTPISKISLVPAQYLLLPPCTAIITSSQRMAVAIITNHLQASYSDVISRSTTSIIAYAQ